MMFPGVLMTVNNFPPNLSSGFLMALISYNVGQPAQEKEGYANNAEMRRGMRT